MNALKKITTCSSKDGFSSPISPKYLHSVISSLSSLFVLFRNKEMHHNCLEDHKLDRELTFFITVYKLVICGLQFITYLSYRSELSYPCRWRPLFQTLCLIVLKAFFHCDLYSSFGETWLFFGFYEVDQYKYCYAYSWSYKVLLALTMWWAKSAQ